MSNALTAAGEVQNSYIKTKTKSIIYRFYALTCMLTIIISLFGCNKEEIKIINPIQGASINLTQTDELTIYLPDWYKEDLQRAVGYYQSEYPDVNVIVDIIEENYSYPFNYTQRISIELMSGMGPDVVVVPMVMFDDIYKIMDTGAFLNLESAINDDVEFRMDDYYQPVLDAGLYKGGRYIIPYCFQLPAMAYNQAVVDRVGFDILECHNTVSFLDEMVMCLPTLRNNPSFVTSINWYRNDLDFMDMSGIVLINYEEQKTLPDEAAFRVFCDAYKSFYGMDKLTDLEQLNIGGDRSEILHNGVALFYWVGDGTLPYLSLLGEAKLSEMDIRMTAMPAQDGAINAKVTHGLSIRSGSTNQRNAWNFIKVVLSEAFQSGSIGGGPQTQFPVNRGALCTTVSNFTSMNHWSKDGLAYILSQEEVQPVYKMLDAISSSRLYCIRPLLMFRECMTPYFISEKSYDECFAELKSKLTIYMSE